MDTEVSEEIVVIYDSERGVITDLYSPDSYYDLAIRGKLCSDTLDNLSTHEIEHRQIDLRNSIDDVYAEESEDYFLDDNQVPMRSHQLLSYDDVVAYARANYDKSQPDSGDGYVPYYDFSAIPGNWDCTNFVSHALLAGGANVYDTGGSGICSTGWYYRDGANRSSSWSSVNLLYDYLINNTHANAPAGTSNAYMHNVSFWAVGDILQFKYSGSTDYDHSTIITVKRLSSDGDRAYAYVTGRTSDTRYNNNQDADDMAPNGSKRTIFVYNY